MAALRQFLSSQWPAGVSALLHGAVLALLLWQMSAPPIAVPESGQIAMAVDLVMVEAPAVTTAAQSFPDSATSVADVPAIDPLSAPPTEVVETARQPLVAEETPRLEVAEIPTETYDKPSPPIDESVAETIVPPPSLPQAKPEKSVVKRQAVPPPKPALSPPAPAAAVEPRGQNRPALTLPPPGAMMMSEQAMASPLMPPVPVGPPVDYVGLVREQLERFKRYPRVAQQRRLQGEVMLSIVIDSGGRVLTYRLIKGSGHEILDREVAELVKRASPLPPIPARLRTERLEIVVPIEFLLQG